MLDDEDEYDYKLNRVCSYPCHICGEQEPVVNLELTPYEARELAGYLSGTDMHLSYGDRLSLSRRLQMMADEAEEI